MSPALPTSAKPSHQLLYLIYGEQDVYRREAKFSILTALAQLKQGESLCIRVMTDRPQDFIGWPVETIELDEQTLTQWQGENGYLHRRKACAIAQGLTLADKTLFVDTDTVFLKSPHRVFELIQPDQYVMDEFEYDWHYVCKRPDYLKLGRHLSAYGVSAGNSFKLYNSGLCGVQASDASLLETAIRWIDEWTQDSFDIHTIEQVAISFAMHGKKVCESRKFVHHYYADKRFFHAMQAHFFSLHGEAFGTELLARCLDVPQFKPVPSAWQRLCIKWKLRNQRKHVKRVGRDLLYGSAAPEHPYYDVCRHGWWESASREIRGWDEAEQRKFFDAHDARWPQQLPRPTKSADEQAIVAYLQQRMAQ
ncbi:hypothetical protein BLL37_07080 [Pseudomonas azotoformans]|uniref:Uncharacterized protein n=1 Tax=Pseudomonas azotoformans TaxID=47878 RepID=A0A1V2JC25_PSEAZ|nr:hypothetical protein [Pseudomonas azotoformans]OIN44264.1 hypothetical protein BFL39_29450 [Pseudomonas azotoformans]ONH42957.1 hypothetical protein BLL37_20965 [Pseudomonas azotoformans]ONH46624.1 hypothetical protein BLL37_07080 [Pseudomonas azotoformans]SDO90041.1 hypothetical protein SAMN04489799_5812 [Pseudomonas azotoformans]